MDDKQRCCGGGGASRREMTTLVDVPVRRSKAALEVCFTCPICSMMFREPHTVVECMHTFCKECIEALVKDQCSANQCPVCHEKLGYSPFKSAEIKSDVLLAEIVKKVFANDEDKAMAEKQQKMEEARRVAARMEMVQLLARKAVAPARGRMGGSFKSQIGVSPGTGAPQLSHAGRKVCVLLMPVLEGFAPFLDHPYLVVGEYTAVKTVKEYLASVLKEDVNRLVLRHFKTDEAFSDDLILRNLNTRAVENEMMYLPMLYGRVNSVIGLD